jgi:hypothetical protein
MRNIDLSLCVKIPWYNANIVKLTYNHMFWIITGGDLFHIMRCTMAMDSNVYGWIVSTLVRSRFLHHLIGFVSQIVHAILVHGNINVFRGHVLRTILI